MRNEYWVRSKSNLDGKRFQLDKAFEGSRKSAKRLAEASKLASKMYRKLPEQHRKYELFVWLKINVMAMLKNRKKPAFIEKNLAPAIPLRVEN